MSRPFPLRLFAAFAALFACACSSPSPPAVDVAAQVDGQPITLAQVDERVQEADPEAWQSLYDARTRAVEYLIDERLLHAEAARLGIERDSLIQREVNEHLPAVTDSAVADFHRRNLQRLGNQPLEEALAGRIRQYLASANHRDTWQAYLGRLRQQAGVQVHLEPPRVVIAVGDGERARGPAGAPVVLVEYSDFECPYCARAQSSVQQVLDTYGDRVRHVYRDYPLSMHPNAHAAAQAGACAHEQGRFWDYHDTLFANTRRLQPDDLRRYAGDLGLDAAAFSECLDSGRHADAVDADMETGNRHGVSGTPAFFVNGRLLSGARPFEDFQQLIDDELRRLDPSL